MLTPSSNLPGRHGPGRPPSLFGLAPDGVCRACRVTTASGGLLPHRFTLTTHNVAVCFLWRCPRVAPPGYCPASCPVEPGLSSPEEERGALRPQRRSVRLPCAACLFGRARPLRPSRYGAGTSPGISAGAAFAGAAAAGCSPAKCSHQKMRRWQLGQLWICWPR